MTERMELIIHIEHKPLFVREPGKVWHCLHTPGGMQTRCHVSFDPVYHPNKQAEWLDGEGFIPPPGERCGRNGCKHQYEMLDTLAALFAKKYAEISALFDLWAFQPKVVPLVTHPIAITPRCTKRRHYPNVDDESDVLVLTCDREPGHAGTVHHDPIKDAEWHE